MANKTLDAIRNWGGGVVNIATEDTLPPNTSPRGRNSLIEPLSASTAVVKKRKGFQTFNDANGQAFAAEVNNQFQYITISGTKYHLLSGTGGQLGRISTTGVYTSTTTGLAASTAPSFAVAQDLCFFVNGTDRYKLRGTTLENFGIEAPASAPTLTATSTGSYTGTYECRVTFYNANTGHESSASATSATDTASAEDLAITNIPTSADTQVTGRKVYIRNTGTMANFFLAATIANNVDTSVTLVDSDASLVTTGPDTDSHDRPVAGVKYLTWHNNRMFAADDSQLYYSNAEEPEAFDAEAVEPINPEDGQKITGLAAIGNVLVIFKERSMWGLFGFGPNDWVLRLISPTLGCTSFRSIVSHAGELYWWSREGLCRWAGTNAPTNLCDNAIDVGTDVWEFSRFDEVVAASLPTEDLVVVSLTETNGTRNTRMLAYSALLSAWVSDGWTGIEASSLAAIENADGEKELFLGNYNGQVFKYAGTNDGVVGGTSSGTFVAGASSITSITSSGFYTTGQGLTDRYVVVQDSDGNLMGQVRISSNTATVLTLATAIAVTNGTTYTFYVGGPNFEWDTKEHDSDAPFVKKRFEFFFLQGKAQTANGVLLLYGNHATSPTRLHPLVTTASGQTTYNLRKRMAFTGLTWKARIASRTPDEEFSLYEVAVRSEILGDNLS
jgi:hypothetical protein